MLLNSTYLLLLSCDHDLPTRSLLLAELEKEEKEKDWYYAQLQNLTKRIDSLPLTENVNAPTPFMLHSSVPTSFRRCWRVTKVSR